MVHRAYCQRDTLNIQRDHRRRIQGSNSRSLPRQNHSVRNGMKMRGLFPLRATIPSRERRGGGSQPLLSASSVSPSCQLPLSTSPVRSPASLRSPQLLSASPASLRSPHLLSASAANLRSQPPQSASSACVPCQIFPLR